MSSKLQERLVIETRKELDPIDLIKIGQTVFERLSEEPGESKGSNPKDFPPEILDSLTRLADGQTIPDER